MKEYYILKHFQLMSILNNFFCCEIKIYPTYKIGKYIIKAAVVLMLRETNSFCTAIFKDI